MAEQREHTDYKGIQASTLLAELVMCGVAYHHAGLDVSDRKSIEAMFTKGDIPVLCTRILSYGDRVSLSCIYFKLSETDTIMPSLSLVVATSTLAMGVSMDKVWIIVSSCKWYIYFVVLYTLIYPSGKPSSSLGHHQIHNAIRERRV